MKNVSETKRKFNLIDLLLLALIVAGALALIFRGNLARQIGLEHSGEKAEFLLSLPALDVSDANLFREGETLTDPATGEILFTMDMDVNRPVQPTQIYEVAGLRFRGVSPDQMLADKISVISTGKVFRRIKDVVDLYYLSQVFELDLNRLQQTLSNSGKMLEDFNGFLYGPEELRHAYNKFRFNGGVNKPPFDEVYANVKEYLKIVLPVDN